MFLSEDEIAELTRVRCRTRRARYERQRQVLVHMGIPFLVRPDGSLVLLRKAVLRLLGASPVDEPPPPPVPGFDWSEAFRQERIRLREKREAKQAKIKAAQDRRRAVQVANGLIGSKAQGRGRPT